MTLESEWGAWEDPRRIEVTVNAPPTILCVRANRDTCLEEGESIEVRQFESLTLSVDVQGAEQLSYQWFRNGHLVTQQDGGKSAEVTVSTADGGVFEYKAQIKNAVGLTQTEPYEITVMEARPKNLKLKVYGNPTVAGKDWIQVDHSDSIQLSIEADGAPEFSYQWYRNGQLIPKNEGGNSAMVTVSTDHFGTHTYYVEVANDLDSAKSGLFEIRVPMCVGSLFRDQGEFSGSSSSLADCSLKAALKNAEKYDTIPITHKTWERKLIAASHLALGDISEALHTVKLIEYYGIRDEMYRHISEQLARRGEHDSALMITFKIDTPEERIDALNSIAILQAKSADETAAKQTFSDSIRIARGLSGSYERKDKLIDIAFAQAEAGNLDKAVNIIMTIEPRSSRDYVLHNLLSSQKIIANIVRLEWVIERIDKVDVRAATMGVVAAAYAGSGKQAEALDILEGALSIVRNIDNEEEKLNILAYLSSVKFKLGNELQALQMLDTILEDARQSGDSVLQDRVGSESLYLKRGWEGLQRRSRRSSI